MRNGRTLRRSLKTDLLSPSLIGWVIYKFTHLNSECRAQRKFFRELILVLLSLNFSLSRSLLSSGPLVIKCE